MSGGYGRGLAFLRGQQEAYGGRDNTYLKNLFLKDGDKAKIWFVNDAEQCVNPLIHMVPMTTKKGTWNKDVLCARRTYEEPQENCPLCVAGEKGPWFRAFFLVAVEFIIHPYPNPSAGWKPVSMRGTTVYREDCKDLRLLSAKDKMATQIQNLYLGVTDLLGEGEVDASEPCSLLGRPFLLSVEGSGAARQDLISKLEFKGEVPVEISALIGNAPDLVGVIEGHMTHDSMKGQRRPAVTGGASGTTASAAPMDELDLGGAVDLDDPNIPAMADDELVDFG